MSPAIELTCYLENYRAIRVYAKAGYRLIGKHGDGTQFRMRRHFADDDAPLLNRKSAKPQFDAFGKIGIVVEKR